MRTRTGEPPRGESAAVDGGPPAPSTPTPDIGQLFTLHAGELYRYLSRWVGSAADDLVADVFVAAMRSRARYDPDVATARAWLFGIATNLLRTHLRSRTREHSATDRMASFLPTATESHEQRVVDQVTAGDAVRVLAAAIGALNENDRDVLLLTSWAGLASNEVAAALGIPAGTVRSRLHRVRRSLRIWHEKQEDR